jgi:parallel beta-helix repeat protein
MGYNTNTVNGPRAIIANNICRNTGWTGIYVQTGGGGTATLTPGPVLVTGNLCSKNAIDASETSGLTGGIWFSNRNSNTVVTGNVIDEMQHVSSGGITYSPAAVTSASTGPTISNNYVFNSLGYGILLTNYAANTNIVGNTIVDTVKNDISHIAVASQTGVGGLLIEGNTLKRVNYNFESILLDQQDGTVVSTVRNNYIKGHDKTTGGSVVATVTEKNAGIKTNRNLYVRMTGNIVDNFHVAIAFSAYWADSIRHFGADLNNNTVRNCLNGFGIASTGNNAVVPVSGSVFDGVTNNISATYGNGSPGGSLAGYVARKDNTRIVVLDRNAAPTVGVWAVGDRAEYTTPTAGGFLGAVCTTAGTPGTWKTFGAVTA